MATKGFKRVAPEPQAAIADPHGGKPPDARRNPASALAAAATVAPTLPPTRIEAPPSLDPILQLNLKVRASLIDQLAETAAQEGTTQKVIVCRALATAGYRIHPDDLSDRSNHRRRTRSPR
jgi:hypothetical protein